MNSVFVRFLALGILLPLSGYSPPPTRAELETHHQGVSSLRTTLGSSGDDTAQETADAIAADIGGTGSITERLAALRALLGGDAGQTLTHILEGLF